MHYMFPATLDLSPSKCCTTIQPTYHTAKVFWIQLFLDRQNHRNLGGCCEGEKKGKIIALFDFINIDTSYTFQV